LSFEHTHRPEGMTPFFAVLDVFFSLRFLSDWRRGPTRRRVILASAICVISLLLACLKASFILNALFAMLPVVYWLIRRKDSFRARLAVLGLAVGTAGTLGLAQLHFSADDPQAKAFATMTLLSVHANLIAEQMKQ